MCRRTFVLGVVLSRHSWSVGDFIRNSLLGTFRPILLYASGCVSGLVGEWMDG